jgi:adenylate cyclase
LTSGAGPHGGSRRRAALFLARLVVWRTALDFFFNLLQGRSQRQGRIREGTLLLLAAGAALVFIFTVLNPMASLQNRLSDVLFQRSAPDDSVLLVEIDDRALSVYGPFGNWPRELHARAIANLRAAGARVIVMDLLFVDPSPEDAVLAESMRQAGNVVLAVAGVQPLAGDDPYLHQVTLVPPEPLRSSAQQVGHINFVPDSDGVFRRVPLAIRDGEGRSFPSIAVAALYAQTLRRAPEVIPVEDGHALLLNQRVPVDENGAMRPNFTALLEDFDRISYADAIAGRLDQALVQGRLVFVGFTATGSPDIHAIPLSDTKQPGVVALANTVMSMNQGIYVRESNDYIVIASLLPLLAVTMYALPRWNLQVTALVLVAMLLATYALSFALFNSDQKLIMNLVYPGLMVPVLYLVGMAHRVAAERADRNEIADLFGRYASPEIVQELAAAADRGQLELGGSIREVTVLFADLRGFTGVSERLPPTEVVNFLNSAFDIMIRSITRNDGIVNKFGGDMVMAIWNAPHDTPDHAIKACRAAVEALAEMEARNLHVEDDPDARFGFGINTGEVVAGNLGSAGRLEYSVIGDPVNVGSRLCGIAGGGEIFIGPRTMELVQGKVVAEYVGEQQLKGRSRGVDVYKVLQVGDVSVRSTVTP